METPQIHCPKCNSTQISANKKGFSGKKAVVGGLLTGGIGLFAGTLGSNKILLTCLYCGNQFAPGNSIQREQNKAGLLAIDKPKRVASKMEFKVARVFAIAGASFTGLMTFLMLITVLNYNGEGKDVLVWGIIVLLLFTIFFIYLAKKYKHKPIQLTEVNQ